MKTKIILLLLALQLACMSAAALPTAPTDGELKRVPAAPQSAPMGVTAAPTATVTVYGVCADVLNVREDHNTSAPVVRNLGRMDIVTVLEWFDDGWAKIGEKEYVNGDWLCGGGR